MTEVTPNLDSGNFPESWDGKAPLKIGMYPISRQTTIMLLVYIISRPLVIQPFAMENTMFHRSIIELTGAVYTIAKQQITGLEATIQILSHHII